MTRYYKDFEEFHTRTQDRKTKYAKTVWSVMPAELREDMDLAAVEVFGVDRAIKLFTSVKFENLMSQEYNYAYFNLNIDSSSAKELTKELENYIQRECDGSRLNQ
jgi:hypothetical protein